MFEISFGELLIIGVVALVVLGPEKLPAVARTFGALVGRMQRFVNSVKSDIQREVDLDGLNTLKQDIQDAAQTFRDRVESESRELQSTFDDVKNDLNKTGQEARDALSDQSLDEPGPDAYPMAEHATEPDEPEPAPPEVDDRQLSLILDEPDEPSVFKRRTPSR